MSNTAILVAVIMATLAVITAVVVSLRALASLRETHRISLFEAYDAGYGNGCEHNNAYAYMTQGAEEFAAWVSLNPEMVKAILDEDDPQQALRKRAKRVIEQEGQY
jgi:hypothetical protein